MRRIRDRLFADPRLDRGWEIATNLVLMAVYGFFAYRFAIDFVATRRPSSLLFLLVQSIVAVFFLTRRRAVKVSVDPFAWAAALAGTWLPLLLRPVAAEEVLAGQALQLAGLAVQVAGISSLARSFGIVPANRGIKTGGLYRFVRHPIYSAYLLSNAGFLINQYSLYNALALLLWLFFKLLRIRYEEELLALDPEYADYMQTTRWRLVPGIY